MILIIAGIATETLMPLGILTGVADRAVGIVMAGYCMVTVAGIVMFSIRRQLNWGALAERSGSARHAHSHRHHVVEVGHDSDRACDNEKDDQHTEGKSQNIIRLIGSGAQMQKED
jgi:hypothetical protein